MGDIRAIRTKFSLALLTISILAMAIQPGVANGMPPNTFCGDTPGLETISSEIPKNIVVPSPDTGISGMCKLTEGALVRGNVRRT